MNRQQPVRSTRARLCRDCAAFPHIRLVCTFLDQSRLASRCGRSLLGPKMLQRPHLAHGLLSNERGNWPQCRGAPRVPEIANRLREARMTKYKLEYIWLDGYTPVPNLRGKTQIKEFDTFPALEQLPLWGFDGSSTMQAEGHSFRLRAEARRHLSGSGPHQRRARDVRSHDAGWRHAARLQHPRHHPRRRRCLVRLRAGIFLLQGRPSARLPRVRLSGAAGPVLHRRRLQERRRHRPRDRRGAPRSLPRCRHQPRRHQRRSGQGPVGIPDFRQGLQEGRRPDLDGALPAAAPVRKVRHRHRVPLQAARRHRLERLGHALQLLDQVHARSRRQGVFRGADGGSSTRT